MKLGIICIVIVCVGIFLYIPSQYNPLTPKGELVGEFVDGWHDGYGDSCGDYPFTSVKLKNYSCDKELHSYDGVFVFGNQYSDVDNLKVGQKIKVSYHQESRGSDTTPVTTINYWVITNIEIIKLGGKGK